MTFLYPQVLFLLFLLPLAWWWRRRRGSWQARMRYSSAELGAKQHKQGLSFVLLRGLEGVRWVIVALILVALARPRQPAPPVPLLGSGIDLMLALDVSSSMKQTDLQPNRLEVARRVLQRFIEQRRRTLDRIGLVLFAGEAFALCPLTGDYHTLKAMLSQVRSGAIQDNTAIGDALATALARLRHSPAQSKVIILVTDGENNTGVVHPLVSARLARKMKVRTYTILVGQLASKKKISRRLAPSPRQKRRDASPQGPPPSSPQSKLSRGAQLLQTIARKTKGRFYLALDRTQLEGSYQKIHNRLERSQRNSPRFLPQWHERFFWFLLLALALLLFDLFLRLTLLRTLP